MRCFFQICDVSLLIFHDSTLTIKSLIPLHETENSNSLRKYSGTRRGEKFRTIWRKRKGLRLGDDNEILFWAGSIGAKEKTVQKNVSTRKMTFRKFSTTKNSFSYLIEFFPSAFLFTTSEFPVTFHELAFQAVVYFLWRNCSAEKGVSNYFSLTIASNFWKEIHVICLQHRTNMYIINVFRNTFHVITSTHSFGLEQRTRWIIRSQSTRGRGGG